IGRIEVDERHTHPGRHMHGGSWAAFADSVAGWATARLMQPKWNFTTAEMKVNAFKIALPGDVIWGIAEPLHVGQRTQVWQVKMLRDGLIVGNFLCTQVLLEPKDKSQKASDLTSSSEVPPIAVGVADTPSPPLLKPALEMPRGPYIEHLGIEATDVDKDCVRGRMVVDERHLHTGRYVHGGVWATFADQLSVWATRENLAPGAIFSTAEFKINLFGAGQLGHVLEAEATPLHRGRRTQVWNVLIKREGKTVAQGTTTQLILPDKS
ncbi:MAG: hotdog fold thioesterase, partial [Thermoleophilaceae bacterium]|nr:hotdog fold thioesterase [Thermoleophilaceae bacterium]